MFRILNILFYHPASEATPNSKITGAYWIFHFLQSGQNRCTLLPATPTFPTISKTTRTLQHHVKSMFSRIIRTMAGFLSCQNLYYSFRQSRLFHNHYQPLFMPVRLLVPYIKLTDFPSQSKTLPYSLS